MIICHGMRSCLKVVRDLPRKVEVPRSVPKSKEPVEEVELHAFGDARSGDAVQLSLKPLVLVKGCWQRNQD